jgi:hypothetical protein
MPLQSGESLGTVCEGDVEDVQAAHEDQTYCDSELVPKAFVEDYD